MDKGLNEKWKKAVLSLDYKELYHLCILERRNNHIFHYYFPILPDDASFPILVLTCSITYYVILERFIFLLGFLKVHPDVLLLQWACDCQHFIIARYLHTQWELRHKNHDDFKLHYDYIVKNLPEEDAVAFVLCYVKKFPQLADWDELKLIYAKAMVRKKHTLKAAVTILSLKGKKDGMCRDISKKIAREIIRKGNMAKEEWEKQAMMKRDGVKPLNLFQWISVICLIIAFFLGRFK